MKITMPPTEAPLSTRPITFKDLRNGDIFQWKYMYGEWNRNVYLMTNKDNNKSPLPVAFSLLSMNPAHFIDDATVIFRVFDSVQLSVPRETIPNLPINN